MHLDEEQIQRLLHGELSRPAETAAREHLAGCADCRRRVADAEREEAAVHALLRAVDDPAPQLDVEAVAAAAQAPVSSRHRPERRLRRRALGHREPSLRWAAGFLLAAIVVGAAYAVPGSPLPDWVSAVRGWMGGGPGATPSTPGPAQAPDERVAGIAVAPGDELLILFLSPQVEGQVDVALTDDAEVGVRAPIGAATFTSDVERLVIDNRGSSASFEVRIPRAAPRVEIRVVGRRIFLKEGARVMAGESQARGLYLLPLTPSP